MTDPQDSGNHSKNHNQQSNNCTVNIIINIILQSQSQSQLQPQPQYLLQLLLLHSPTLHNVSQCQDVTTHGDQRGHSAQQRTTQVHSRHIRSDRRHQGLSGAPHGTAGVTLHNAVPGQTDHPVQPGSYTESQFARWLAPLLWL